MVGFRQGTRGHIWKSHFFPGASASSAPAQLTLSVHLQKPWVSESGLKMVTTGWRAGLNPTARKETCRLAQGSGDGSVSQEEARDESPGPSLTTISVRPTAAHSQADSSQKPGHLSQPHHYLVKTLEALEPPFPLRTLRSAQPPHGPS